MESVFYHVTFKNRLDSILSEGIRGFNVSHIYSDYIRKHDDSVYAFANFEDALKWWEYQEETIKMKEDDTLMAEGKQIIIKYKDNIFAYFPDEHREMKKDFQSAMYKIAGEIVKPEQIQEVIEYSHIKDTIKYDLEDEKYFLLA